MRVSRANFSPTYDERQSGVHYSAASDDTAGTLSRARLIVAAAALEEAFSAAWDGTAPPKLPPPVAPVSVSRFGTSRRSTSPPRFVSNSESAPVPCCSRGASASVLAAARADADAASARAARATARAGALAARCEAMEERLRAADAEVAAAATWRRRALDAERAAEVLRAQARVLRDAVKGAVAERSELWAQLRRAGADEAALRAALDMTTQLPPPPDLAATLAAPPRTVAAHARGGGGESAGRNRASPAATQESVVGSAARASADAAEAVAARLMRRAGSGGGGSGQGSAWRGAAGYGGGATARPVGSALDISSIAPSRRSSMSHDTRAGVAW